ncbi:60S ribosomal protein L30-like [Sceloporus undulatus]|uniref:60S ribosomal protein L30-like n=1 Tax=Sceloporus undulatus TaxID=8520 RepID=UPI001C4AAC33|nr:60S ribosomal protein L30-like [Sceloporus undulatus]
MVVGKKTKIKVLEFINSRLQLAMQSSEYVLRYKQTLKRIQQGKAKVLILAHNCPLLRKSDTEFYSILPKTDVHHNNSSNTELDTACGKYCTVSTLDIVDPGDSFVIGSMPEQTTEK